MIGRKLLAMPHLEGLHPQIVSQHLVHGGFAYTSSGGQGSAASAIVSLQIFPRVFEELRGEEKRFLLRPGRSRVFPVSWNFFTIFHTAERLISSRFAISTLLFSTHVKHNHWISVYSHCKTIFFENFGILSLKVGIISFQMVIILRKLTILKGFYRKTKLVALIHEHPVLYSIVLKFFINRAHKPELHYYGYLMVAADYQDAS